MNVHPKVTAAAVAGAVSVLIVFAASAAGLDVPPDVASAITTLVAFAAGYLTPAG